MIEDEIYEIKDEYALSTWQSKHLVNKEDELLEYRSRPWNPLSDNGLLEAIQHELIVRREVNYTRYV